jgi:hypothetical protein
LALGDAKDVPNMAQDIGNFNATLLQQHEMAGIQVMLQIHAIKERKKCTSAVNGCVTGNEKMVVASVTMVMPFENITCQLHQLMMFP